ncbi:hypothetical protein NP493_471g02050 [Ridgeia piscesae]|uniref:HECT-type E3 ubiquitin transferase n=1 Tax=Ridgeia piscesae TaxID=27915 RepID=A0AAD9KYS7_RIDPI|nr:hypothetical protein NP493_471g02050 [Ridgeia piscesae]
MALTFVRSKEEFGQSVDVPLVEGGENMRVTLYNKHEYAQLWAQSVLREDHLPTASTCSNQLHLPHYQTQEQMKEKLATAISIGKEGLLQY